MRVQFDELKRVFVPSLNCLFLAGSARNYIQTISLQLKLAIICNYI